MRKDIVAFAADHTKVNAMRNAGCSWSEIFGYFSGGRQIDLAQAEADALHKSGFALWVGRRRMLITSRVEAIARLHDLSAVAGEHVATNRKKDWVGPFIRAQFGRWESDKGRA